MSDMFARGDNADASTGGAPATAYPTQWALNPGAYHDVDASEIDWAALAQRWIQMKETAPPVAVADVAPVPPITAPVPAYEETSDAMELEEPDATANMPAAPWTGVGAAPVGWGTAGWNEWGWGWSGAGDMKTDNVAPVTMMNYASPDPPIAGYSTSELTAPSYETGYWTAPVETQPVIPEAPMRKSYETKSSSRRRRSRDRPSSHHSASTPAPVIINTPALDAAKRKQLPAWIREGLEKMEREKARAAERDAAEAAAAELERQRRAEEEREMERIRSEGGIVLPTKSKFESDSEGEEVPETVEEEEPQPQAPPSPPRTEQPPPELPVQRSREEILQDIMLMVRRTLTEILLEVTDHEIETVSQEELTRYHIAQATRINAVGKSKALSAITSGLGLAAYGSSDSESGSEEEVDNDLTDAQLQDMIRKRRLQFEKTSREIEAELREAEAREAGEGEGGVVRSADVSNGETKHSSTPEHRRANSRNSATPPPVHREPSAKLTPDRRISRDSKDVVKREGKSEKKKLETIYEKPKKKNITDEERNHTPSVDSIDSEVSDSLDDSSSSSSSSSSSKSSSSSNNDVVPKKRKRPSSSETDVHKSSSKSKKQKSSSRRSEKNYGEKSSKKKKENDEGYSKHKSSRSSHRDYDEHYEKSHKQEKELKSKRKDDYDHNEKSYKYDKSRHDDDHKLQRREKDSKSRYSDRDYEKSRSRYKDEDEKHQRYQRSHSQSYEKRSRTRDRSEDRYRAEEKSSRRKERRHSRERSHDRLTSRRVRSRSRSRGHRR